MATVTGKFYPYVNIYPCIRDRYIILLQQNGFLGDTGVLLQIWGVSLRTQAHTPNPGHITEYPKEPTKTSENARKRYTSGITLVTIHMQIKNVRNHPALSVLVASLHSANKEGPGRYKPTTIFKLLSLRRHS